MAQSSVRVFASVALAAEVSNDLRFRLAALTLYHRALLFGFVSLGLRAALGFMQISRNALVAFHHHKLSVIRML